MATCLMVNIRLNHGDDCLAFLPQNPLESLQGKNLKLFFVEVDDEDRERVVECRVGNLTVRMDSDYADVLTDYSMVPVASYRTRLNYVLEEMTLEPLDDTGIVMRLRNFPKEETEE